MKRCLAPLAIAVLCSVPLRADVTITQTMSMEGGAAAMSGGNMQSRMVMRIKGLKARNDMDIAGQAFSSVADLTRKEMYFLRPDQKTATLMSGGPAGTSLAGVPKMDVSFKPTGKSRAIQNVQCDEYAITMAMDMSQMGASQQMPPEAAAMLQGVKMVVTGSMWIAKSGPGSADYVAFQKAAAAGGMASILGGAMGQASNNMSQMLSAIAEAPGIPYLSEMNMGVEGTGQMVEMMKQMGAMKLITTVTGVSTDPIPDDLFKVPADYKVVKQ